MICPNCGKDNSDTYRFCIGCGTSLESVKAGSSSQSGSASPAGSKEQLLEELFENEKTVILDDTDFLERDETVILKDMDTFEKEETVILNDMDPFEKEETVILDDMDPFKKEETMILDDYDSFEDEKTVILSESKPADFRYSNPDPVPVYKEDFRGQNQDMAYIEHLRALKGLLDDGIITEDEFTRKKKQILGI